MERRKFLKNTAILGAAASVLSTASFASTKGVDKIKVGLIGCGGRGTGAFLQMLEADKNVQLVAMADCFRDALDNSARIIQNKIAKKKQEDAFNVKESQKFVGLDSYKQLLECDLDIVIEASPPVFRPSHTRAIVEANKNAFIEKPACVDINQAREMYETAKLASEKGLCIGVGIQRRHHAGYVEGVNRVLNGDIGEIVSAQCYWNTGGYVGAGQVKKFNKPPFDFEYDDVMYQIRCWPAFVWTSGDNIVEQHVHNLDVCRWALGDVEPIEVEGMGSRSSALESPKFGDRYTSFAVDYTMPNGVHVASYCRQEPEASVRVSERIKGTKGTLESSLQGVEIKGEKPWNSSVLGRIPQAMVQEHVDLLDAIKRGDKKYNHLKGMIDSTVMAIAGRMSAFTGRNFKYDVFKARFDEDLMPDLTKQKNDKIEIACASNYKIKQLSNKKA